MCFGLHGSHISIFCSLAPCPGVCARQGFLRTQVNLYNHQHRGNTRISVFGQERRCGLPPWDRHTVPTHREFVTQVWTTVGSLSRTNKPAFAPLGHRPTPSQGRISLVHSRPASQRVDLGNTAAVLARSNSKWVPRRASPHLRAIGAQAPTNTRKATIAFCRSFYTLQLAHAAKVKVSLSG